MCHEINSGTLLGSVLITLSIVVGLFFSVLGFSSENPINYFWLALLCFSIALIIAAIRLIVKNDKLGLMECVCDSVEQTVFRLQKGKNLKVIDKYEMGTYDTLQRRVKMKKVPLWKVLRCRSEDVSEDVLIVISRTLKKHIIGVVEEIEGYYKIGDTFLAKGLIVLHIGEEVDLKLEVPVSYTSSVGIYDKYTVLD